MTAPMSSVRGALHTLWCQSREDLRPVPGRMGQSWRVALLCALVAGASMLFKIPEAALSCYLIIFLMKSDAVANIVTGIGLLLLLPGLIALLTWLINLTSGSTMHIMAGIVISSVLLVYLGAATQLGEQGNVAALIIAFLMTLIVQAPFAEAASFALREAWAMAAMPMLFMIGFNLVLGMSPVSLLRHALCLRLAAAAEALETGNQNRLRGYLRQGNTALQPPLLAVRVLRLVPLSATQQIATDVRAGFALMLAISALPAGGSQQGRTALAAAIHAARHALDHDTRQPPVTLPDNLTPAEQQAWQALQRLAGVVPQATVAPTARPPFMAADAFSNPAYWRFALKTTLAAMLCFLIYTTIDWQGIHTAMITCYVAALTTTGETLHKLLLRITGCLIGAVLGITAIFLIIPHIDDVGSLMVLVFAGCLLSAWIASGPERIAYAGVQVALAFLLTVLQGFGPSLSLETIQGRLVGILLGNLVVYLIFSFVWPTTVEKNARQLLASALTELARMARMPAQVRINAIDSAASVTALTGKAEEALALLPFEPRRLRPTAPREAALKQAITELEALCAALWLSREPTLEPLAQQLEWSAATITETPLAAPAEARPHPDPGLLASPLMQSLNRITGAIE